MAAPSKSSQKAKNVVLALLALWSIVSLIIIVVWATSPDLKPSTQCRAELKELNEKVEEDRVAWSKNKEALEERVLKEMNKVDQQKDEILLLHKRLNGTNAALEECQQEKVSYSRNQPGSGAVTLHSFLVLKTNPQFALVSELKSSSWF